MMVAWRRRFLRVQAGGNVNVLEAKFLVIILVSLAATARHKYAPQPDRSQQSLPSIFGVSAHANEVQKYLPQLNSIVTFSETEYFW